MYRLAAAFTFANLVLGQQVGTQTAEKHPALPIEVCTSSGCTKEETTAVLDVSAAATSYLVPFFFFSFPS